MYKKIAIIGAGVMGSGIAAQFANNNVNVLLYDLENENGLIAKQAIDKLISSLPSGLTHPTIADSITPLSLKKHLNRLEECDLIIEAIVENLSVKQQFYNDAKHYLKEAAILASNTSTFRLHQLTNGLDPELAKKMVICHFFNPPRFMRLLEFIPGNLQTNVKNNLVNFLTHTAGKEVILCKDTPGFIANRLGCFLMETIFQESIRANIDIVAVDTVFSKLLGFPNTGIFALYDLIGLDVMQMIAESLKASLEPSDEFNSTYKKIPQIGEMIKTGFKGRKGKGGFYKIGIDANGKKQKYVLDLKSFEYKSLKSYDLEYSSLTDFLNSDSGLAKFIGTILNKFFSYTMKVQDQIANDIYSIDAAMQLGYAWKYGPFELMYKFDLTPQVYISKFNELKIDPSNFGIKSKSLSSYIKKDSLKPLATSDSTKIWKLNENKICFEITSKMHTLNRDVFSNLLETISIAEETDSDLIIYSDSDYFSAGADLNLFYQEIIAGNFIETLSLLELGQQVMKRLKYSRIPIISCARGVALGGGCEILLHSDYVVAHQDLSAGLVETSIGLIPGWGGVKEMILRSNSAEDLNQNLSLILKHYKSTSALDFAVSYKHKNVISLANNNDLLEYALNNKFTKISHDINSTSISNFKPDHSNIDENIKEIALLLSSKIAKGQSEDELLQIEQDIFLRLLKTQNSKEKIGKLVS